MHHRGRSGCYAEFRAALRSIECSGYQLACFDFGGTLFDFAPLHVRAFLGALYLKESSAAAHVVDQTVRSALIRGDDSFGMSRLIAKALDLPSEYCLNALVVRKRSIVEGYLEMAKLERPVCEFLIRAVTLCPVAVLSLGLVRSMEGVFRRSLGGLSGQIAIYGRHSLSDRTDKFRLLRRVVSVAGVPGDLVLYAGDAELDEAAGREVGTAFIRLRPFR